MAVTNSLFMLACPPLFHSELAPPRGPNNKRSGGDPLLSVASEGGSVWPCQRRVYHNVAGTPASSKRQALGKLWRVTALANRSLRLARGRGSKMNSPRGGGPPSATEPAPAPSRGGAPLLRD